MPRVCTWGNGSASPQWTQVDSGSSSAGLFLRFNGPTSRIMGFWTMNAGFKRSGLNNDLPLFRIFFGSMAASPRASCSRQSRRGAPTSVKLGFCWAMPLPPTSPAAAFRATRTQLAYCMAKAVHGWHPCQHQVQWQRGITPAESVVIRRRVLAPPDPHSGWPDACEHRISCKRQRTLFKCKSIPLTVFFRACQRARNTEINSQPRPARIASRRAAQSTIPPRAAILAVPVRNRRDRAPARDRTDTLMRPAR